MKKLLKTTATFLITFLIAVLTAIPSHGVEERLKLTSPAFGYFGNLPLRYTCVGPDVSPPLGWVNVPEGCKSLALVLMNSDDSSVNWLVWNINPGLKGFPEGVDLTAAGAVAGKNDAGSIRYKGPCPTRGKTKYSIVLYALRDTVDLKAGSDKRAFYKAISHLVAEEYTFVFFSGSLREH